MFEFYLDESGELGFSAGSSKHFLIAILETTNSKRLKNALKSEKKKLHNLGWPTNIEIKGTSLFHCHRNEQIPDHIANNKAEHIQKILQRVLSSGAKPHYFVIQKNKITKNLREAPYGILYNYYTNCLFSKIHAGKEASDISLIVDQRNKETHSHMDFDGYLNTKIIAECNHQGQFQISHEDSQKRLGLQAVDFIAWGLFRYYEHNDNQFKTTIGPYVNIREKWYAK